MTNLLIKFIANALALAAAVWLVGGISLGDEGTDTGGRVLTLVIVALIFGLVNLFVKPILQFFALPLLILTLGLFALVINALMLMLTGWLAGSSFQVDGFWSALLGGLVISIVTWAVTSLLDRD
ncbi:phage holin family protein [Streptomyces alkaliphilus]|uniref:Phage holin family protein n=1 Tax=Streptomyces alkaliphilus TaxID=1472722 RepID=A0A7W3TB85_9ACTN|nr:phage holin family protein [Streptomyces alkaliphilus]MBB0243678.1 phage holin family protein [Streptomyces alkaliphilus]MQS10082.1 phage holin family protein [Streptomyces alkaliphilus]